jgi:Caspase domain
MFSFRSRCQYTSVKTVMSLNHQPDEDLTKLEKLLAEHDAGDKPAQVLVAAAPAASAPAAVAPVVAAIPPAAASPAAVIAAAPSAGPLKGHYALVIGDDKYVNFPTEQQLVNAYSDASAIGDALKDMGYEVMRGQNLSRQGMVDKLAAFTSQLHDGDTALFQKRSQLRPLQKAKASSSSSTTILQ